MKVKDYEFAVEYPNGKYWIILKLECSISGIWTVHVHNLRFIGEPVLKSEKEAMSILDKLYFDSIRKRAKGRIKSDYKEYGDL